MPDAKVKTIAVDAETHSLVEELMHVRRASSRGAAVRLAVEAALQSTAEA